MSGMIEKIQGDPKKTLRAHDISDMFSFTRKLNIRYDLAIESEIVDWMNNMLGENIPKGREQLQEKLKNGVYLLQLINIIYSKTPNLPERAQSLSHPFKVNEQKISFKHIENLQVFLDAANAYGVPVDCLFQTGDLYEARNMSQVLNMLLRLGTECQRHGMQGSTCGPKPCSENRRNFSADKLRSSEAIICQQAGNNKGANQSGMSIGSFRHGGDIKVNSMDQKSEGIISQQSGTNKYANQSGMNIGSMRHVADIKVDPMDKSGRNIISLQYGSNQGANQKGMTMGSLRHIADFQLDKVSKSGEGVIGLQYGSNKGANQAGMQFGCLRHVAGIKVDPLY